jgi:hypothetical protein
LQGKNLKDLRNDEYESFVSGYETSAVYEKVILE